MIQTKSILTCFIVVILNSCQGVVSSTDIGKKPLAEPEPVDRPLELIQTVQWQIGGSIIEARLEKPASHNATDLGSRLIVRNLTSGKNLFLHDQDAVATNIQRTSFRLDGKDGLAVTWASGSGDILGLFSVDANSVNAMLEETFRDFYFPITSATTGVTDIYLIDTSLKSNTTVVRKYVLENSAYKFRVEIPYEKFVTRLDDLFLPKK